MQRTATRAEAARCGIVPPYLLAALAMCDDPDLAVRATRTLERDTRARQQRLSPSAPFRPTESPGESAAPAASSDASTAESGSGADGVDQQAAGGPHRTVADAQNGETLPGQTVRTEGQDPVQDIAVNEAYDGLGSTCSLFAEAFDRDSLDGKGLPLLASVHFGHDYDNAYWDGRQMVFGDGDGRVFGSFTAGVDVIGHELTHGVTEFTAGLRYAGQSGALNESVSDVFGILVKQRLLGQSAEQSDWLIGADLLLPGVNGVALRSMKEPGTAYDDPTLGKDPQPGHMDGYVDTASDNGGVHLNSGIPNRAFCLAAIAIGGNAWEAAGRIWYAVLTGPIRADCDFATFAALAVDAAGELFGADSAEQQAVRGAWEQVGVIGVAEPDGGDDGAGGDPADASGPAEPGQPPAGSGVDGEITVRRTGGFAGTTAQRTVRLAELPPAEAQQWVTVLQQRTLRQLSGGSPAADRFVYEVELSGYASFGGPLRARVAEQDLPAELAELLYRTLRGQ